MVIVGLMEKDGIRRSQMQGSENHLAVMRELSEVTCIPDEIKKLYGNLIKIKIMEENTDKVLIETEVVEYFTKMGYSSEEFLDKVEPYAKIYVKILFILKTNFVNEENMHSYLNHYEVYDEYVRKGKRIKGSIMSSKSHSCIITIPYYNNLTSISPGGDAEEERVAIYRNVTAEKRSFIERLRKKFKRRLNLIGKYFVSTINFYDFT